MSQKTVISLAREVLGQCSSDSIIVSLDLCVYLLDLKLLQISKDFSNVIHNADLTETLVKKCVKELKENSLSLQTLKLQLNWRKKYQSRDEIKKIHHERIFKNILPLMSEIVEEDPIKGVEKDRLYKKIVTFIIMFAGLGSPFRQSIIKETQAALQSIFKATEVENFLSLSKATKEQQLIELARLITGIILFMKDCKKGGEKMDDLPLILNQGVRATKERLINFKDKLDQKIDTLVNVLQQSCSKNHLTLKQIDNDVSLRLDFQIKNLEEFKNFLIYYRQIEYCLNDLIKDLEKSFVIIEELVQRLQTTLIQVHNVVRYRVAVATAQVFPLFLELSNVWVEMQEEVDILSEINNNLEDLSVASKLTLSTLLEMPLSNENTLPSETTEISDCVDCYPGVKVCSISSVLSIDHVQYKGFCAWTLAYAEGLLINGNVAIGVIQFLNRFYTFSSAEAAHKWALNPNHYINTVLRVARVKPELIKFLSLEEDLSEKFPIEEDKTPTIADAQVQTDLHPLENFLNKEYTFSEWELKRRVMKLATLTKCVTKSQQTAMQSCFRAEMAVQAPLSKNASSQTTKDKSSSHSSVPKSAWYLTTKPSQLLLTISELNLGESTKN